MGIAHDIAGQRFGLLVAIEIDQSFNKTGHYRGNKWVCRCDCGKIKSCLITNLRRGLSTSCGCNRKGKHMTHGLRHSRSYNSWHSMIRRCENKDAAYYHRYGGRGISVCERWHSFELFYEDMGERPEGTSLDRKDNNKGYYKENCRWGTEAEQRSNTSRSRRIDYMGEVKTITEWSKITGINVKTIEGRIKRGWGVDRAFCSGL